MFSSSLDGTVRAHDLVRWGEKSHCALLCLLGPDAPVAANVLTVVCCATLALCRYRQFRVLTSPTPTQFTALAADPTGEIVCAGAMDPFEIYVWSVQVSRTSGPRLRFACCTCVEFARTIAYR